MVDWILHLHGIVAYAIIFALPALEASIFLGFIFPGEIAVLLGGVLAYQGRVSLLGAMAAAIAGAIIGDSVGYEVGRHAGAKLLDGPLRRFIKPKHKEKATAFLRKHGGKAVLLGRFTAALRVLVPGMAGIAEIPYRTFLLYNVIGGVLWASSFTLLGYVVGNGYTKVQHYAGRASVVLLSLVVSIGIIVLIARWIAHNPDRLRGWWARFRARPLMRHFVRQLDFLERRLHPGGVLGLELTLGVIAVALIGIAFGSVAQSVIRQRRLFHFDQPVLDWIVLHRSGGTTAIMKAITVLGSPIFLTVAAAAIGITLAVRRSWLRIWLVVGGVAGASLLERLVKIVISRPRPTVHALVKASGYGFPSGHATMSAAFYGALALVIARSLRSWPRVVATWAVAVVLIALIGFSRLYLGVHYLTDVLGGFALGLMWLVVMVVAVGLWTRARTTEKTPDPSPESSKQSQIQPAQSPLRHPQNGIEES
ncbi:MAG: hypothetical protein NVSMB57_04530 [Actinomycetota bacterium]